MDGQPKNTYQTLERLTKKWWFYLLLFIILFFIPFYTAVSVERGEEWRVVGEVLGHSLIPYRPFQPILHTIIILLITALFICRNRFRTIFTAFVGIHYIVIAFVQNIAITDRYGLAIITSNVIWFSIIGFFWIWETIVKKTDFTFVKQPLWKYWVIPLAILAFWAPDVAWDFNLIYLLTSSSPLAFCMMTPIYLAIFSFIYPKVNFPALRVTSFIGSFIGIFNMLSAFAIGGSEGLYLGFIHIPLLAISLYCFIISVKRSKVNEFKS